MLLHRGCYKGEGSMIVERILISGEQGEAKIECESAELESGMGIYGDRNYGKRIYPGQNITLVEAEEIEQFCQEFGLAIDLSLTRRNLITRGIRLNGLINKEFKIGSAILRGVELCEPCLTLGNRLTNSSLSPAAVVRRWLGRGGLRADIIKSGLIQRSSVIEVMDEI